MKSNNKFSAMIILVSLLCLFLSSSVSAVSKKGKSVDKFYSYNQKLLCISYRGDTAYYPENSLKGVKSALEKGADFVSVSLDKTSDGVFYLCERESLGNVCNAEAESLSQLKSDEVDNYRCYDVYGNETEYVLTSLDELLNNTDNNDGLILDVLSEDKDAVYEILKEKNALERVIIRTDDSCDKLLKWADSKSDKVYVIGVYDGNIIFNTVSSINKITEAEMPAVQYISNNYFNVAFGDFFANRYLCTANARAVAATYSLDLCGQRGDCSDGWNELINKGYSVIETNNIEAFVAYRNESERLEKLIAELLEKSFYVDPAKYSEVSLSNLKTARLNCEIDITPAVISSLDEMQKDYSQLLFALEDMKISSGEVDTRGALNITAGKIVAAVLVGAALLSWQICVYKMRKSNKEK